MPELPELQAHAERLTEGWGGNVLRKFTPLSFTAMKTAVPPASGALDHPLVTVGRRGKYLLLDFEALTFAVHLMQGGRLKPDPKQAPKPRGGVARWMFDDRSALMLSEQGKEHRAGVWTDAEIATGRPRTRSGPDHCGAARGTVRRALDAGAQVSSAIRGASPGSGRRLANEICHRAKVSPFASTSKLGLAGAEAVVIAIRECVAESLAYERTRQDMSASADRPGAVHHRTGQACPVCGDAVREVSYSAYTVNYCPTCQTGGKVLADNTTSKFLK